MLDHVVSIQTIFFIVTYFIHVMTHFVTIWYMNNNFNYLYIQTLIQTCLNVKVMEKIRRSLLELTINLYIKCTPLTFK